MPCLLAGLLPASGRVACRTSSWHVNLFIHGTVAPSRLCRPCFRTTQFTRVLNILEDYCDMRGFRYLRLDGSTPIARRAYEMARFARENIFLYLITTRAGGVGLNLQGMRSCVLSRVGVPIIFRGLMTHWDSCCAQPRTRSSCLTATGTLRSTFRLRTARTASGRRGL